MSEMIERVARAIHRERFKVAAPCPDWASADPVLHETARALARAAIEAMREPIYEARAVFGKLDLAKLHSEDPYLHSIVRHAMDSLDAALADPEKESA